MHHYRKRKGSGRSKYVKVPIKTKLRFLRKVVLQGLSIKDVPPPPLSPPPSSTSTTPPPRPSSGSTRRRPSPGVSAPSTTKQSWKLRDGR